MRYIADSNGYLEEVAFGSSISCGGVNCVEYTGSIPSGYDSLEDWYSSECGELCKWKIVSGNLTQDSSREPSVDTSLFDFVYPVGSIYMNVNDTSPATLFGVGTWERIQDRFILAAGTSYEAGSTGGEATHVLTVDEMPSHSHEVTTRAGSGSTTNQIESYANGDSARTCNTNNSGGGQAHNNMPPYLAVYVWKRTS